MEVKEYFHMASLDDLLMVLENIALNSEDNEFEAGGVFTIAGPTGSYFITSPFNTECEWMLYDASAVTGTGLIAISSSNPSLQNMTTSTGPTIGLASGGADNNAFDGILIPVSSTQNHIPNEFWMPLGRGKGVFIALTISSGAAFCSIAFRRKLQKVIPVMPRMKPHTHVPLSARRVRTYSEAQADNITGAMANVSPEEDTSYTGGRAPAGANPMEKLDRLAKRGLK